MAFLKKHSAITKRTAKNLSNGESDIVDFKLKPAGLQVEDLVAFANTNKGGEIILGIDERKNSDGSQYGVPTGCDLSDDVALQILNKAVSAIPPISVKLIAENVRSAPIIRIMVPPSEGKPHCTPKGTYLRRDGSRNRPLHPSELLRIFLDSESRAFADRFENAAETISANLEVLEASLSDSVDNMASQLGWVDSQLGGTESTMQSAAAYSKLAMDEANDISTRLRAIFRQDGRKDPVHQKVRTEFLEEIKEQFRDDPSLIEKIKSKSSTLQLSASGKAAIELTKDELREIFEEAFKEITGEDFQPKQ